VVSPIPKPGVRCWQRQGLKHSETVTKMSGTSLLPWEMIGMDNVSEVLELRIVKAAGLEPPFGPSAKMAMVGRSVSIDGEPTHLWTHPVYRDILTRFVCRACGTW